MSKHMKRLTAPRSWMISRKENTWATKPRSGPHSIKSSLPLLMVVRDYLHHTDSGREARRIIGDAQVLVDRTPTRDHKRPVGLMDVVSIPATKENYRVLFDRKGKLRLVRTDDAGSKWKLVRIDGKTTLKGGKTQLNLHDGRNIIVEKDVHHVGDVLKISLPDQEILSSLKLEKDSLAMIIGGSHMGEIAVIDAHEKTATSQENVVSFKEGFRTTRHNVFVIGKKTPEITLPEVKAA